MLINVSDLQKNLGPNKWNLAEAVAVRFETDASIALCVDIWQRGETRFVAEGLAPGPKQQGIFEAKHWRFIFRRIAKRATERSKAYRGGKDFQKHRH